MDSGWFSAMVGAGGSVAAVAVAAGAVVSRLRSLETRFDRIETAVEASHRYGEDIAALKVTAHAPRSCAELHPPGSCNPAATVASLVRQ